MQKSLSSPGICENKSTEESRDKSSASGSHACLIPQCAEIILRYSSRGIQMNPSALFTYARASISRSTSAREKPGRKKRASLERARHLFRILFLLCSALHPLFYTLHLEPLAAPFFLANLHILPFSCIVMNNPYPFSSLSHLHLLPPFVKRVDSFDSVIYLSRKFCSRFHDSVDIVNSPGKFAPGQKQNYRNLRRERADNLEIFLTYSTLDRPNLRCNPDSRSPIQFADKQSLDFRNLAILPMDAI